MTEPDLDAAELARSPVVAQLAGKRAFVFDRDGTLSLGDDAIPSAHAFLDLLRSRGVRCLVMTNNSSKTAAQHAEKLAAKGLVFDPADVCVSTHGAIAHLRDQGIERLHWVATESVSQELRDAGFTYDDTTPQAALLTYDTELTYAKIAAFAHTLRAGVRYFATHPDLVCPTPDGPIPDIGSYMEMFRTATDRLPEKVFGKPDVTHIEAALSRLGIGLEDAVVVGDRLYTDIAVAEGNALTSILVLTGETTRAMYAESATRADLVVASLDHLVPHL